MERFMRVVPFWQPLQEKEILPTAESDLEDEMMGKRARDALLGALLLIGVAVAMAQFLAALGNLVAERTASKNPVASSLYACVLTDDESPSETRPMLKAPEEESAGNPVYEYELSLGLGKTAMLLVYYLLHNGFLLVLMSWCMLNNLMLGSAGIVWEAMGLWLVAVLAVDVLGYLGRAIQAAWIGRKVPSPAMTIIMSIVPILGPRVDLLKDCVFTASVLQLAACAEDEGTRQRGFWIGVCSLVTLFTPGPFLFCDGASRMEVAKEFLPALGVRLKAVDSSNSLFETARSEGIRGGWSPLVVDVLLEAGAEFVKVLSQQSTPARLWIAIGEDVPQAVLAVMAMLNFHKFSGLLLLNLVFCCVKIAGILAVRWLLRWSGVYTIDPSAIAIMAAPLSDAIARHAM
ncbi:ANK2 [Symbiodinium sp. CCMP2592]|nr:ANK2 [Symbiodinium sp. CCMP2592]